MRTNTALRTTLESAYELAIKEVVNGPRGFVAETFIITTTTDKKYFCKLVTKPVFVRQLQRSLPILDAIHDIGFDRIPHPIKTTNNMLWTTYETGLVVLMNYIDAPQNYDYDNFAFGALTAQTHQLTSKLSHVAIEREDFSYEHRDEFEKRFLHMDARDTDDPITDEFTAVAQQHRLELQQYYALFLKISQTCKQTPQHFVLTHGDSPGNTLVKTPTDLFIIDWDDALLAPAERDVWFLDHKPDFLAGYRSIFPDYTIDAHARTFSVLNYHFNSLVHFTNEIFSQGTEEYRRSNIAKLAEHLSDKSWIYTYLQQIKNQ